MAFFLAAALLFGQTATPVASPDSYVKSSSNDKGIYSLETAAHLLTAPGKPDVWLVGVAHIGEKKYYAGIQELLNKQDEVLFEGVKASKPKAASKTAVTPPSGTAPKPIYKVLSDALGLDFQLMDINYNHPNWVDSDLSMDELEKLDKASSDGKPSSFHNLMQMLDPNSPVAQQLASSLQMLTPGGIEGLKKFMIEKLSTIDPNTALFDPATANIILTERNKSVEGYFAKAVGSPTPPKSVAIFYGALHQASIERELKKSYGYHLSETRWFKAASADTNKIDATGQTILQMLEKQFDTVMSGSTKAKP